MVRLIWASAARETLTLEPRKIVVVGLQVVVASISARGTCRNSLGRKKTDLVAVFGSEFREARGRVRLIRHRSDIAGIVLQDSVSRQRRSFLQAGEKGDARSRASWRRASHRSRLVRGSIQGEEDQHEEYCISRASDVRTLIVHAAGHKLGKTRARDQASVGELAAFFTGASHPEMSVEPGRDTAARCVVVSTDTGIANELEKGDVQTSM